MKKRKILQFPLTNSGSGVSRYILQNWKYIDKQKFQFDFATMNKELNMEPELRKEGCEVFHISCYAEDNPLEFSKEVTSILSHGYDAVHLHTSYWKSLLIEEMARKLGIPKIIIHAHNSSILEREDREDREKRHWQCVKELNENIATDFWACSRKAADWLYGDSIPKDKIVIVKNAINTKEFKFSEEERRHLRKQLGLQEDFVIGHVGRLTYQKNQEFLLRIFAQINKKYPFSKLLIVGNGPDKDKLQSLIKKNGLEKKVIMMEYREDINMIMNAMDLFVLPSLFEGFPIVLVEAQASGLKCLVSDRISSEVAITDGIEFLTLEEDRWIREIEKVMLQGTTFNRAQMASVVSSAGYDIEKQIKEIELLYMRRIFNEIY